MLAQAIDTGRLEAAREHLRRCTLCEHRCGANRVSGELGFCRAGAAARVYRHRVEYGEEIELVPSHLFYLSGCDLRCGFCIGADAASDPGQGKPLTARFLSDALAWGRRFGPRNLQWVGGEPTIHLPAILEAMSECGELPPIVWKSNFHATPEALNLLDGMVDVYVADFKFGNDACGRRIAGVDSYWATLTRNLLIAVGQGDLIVRHLLLPGHFDCCYRPIVRWMKCLLPSTKFNIRDGYLPCWKAERYTELTAPVDAATSRMARDLAREAGLNLIA
jgi:putative pyruvate formate lyase activating enzyme